ncbi:uncharacterized protein LOC121398820 isoform X2 [Xenopus laevis]|uniref:Uncharacterized protein LOC121398820 isoform X2 n=1 Tax=Xenopus laevis TaxID=8355 RepID=A0A8J1LX61_XENLA|nr:uncharacterized protein LOC121398820 isoform X2 [Xenopus laevis]
MWLAKVFSVGGTEGSSTRSSQTRQCSGVMSLPPLRRQTGRRAKRLEPAFLQSSINLRRNWSLTLGVLPYGLMEKKIPLVLTLSPSSQVTSEDSALPKGVFPASPK